MWSKEVSIKSQASKEGIWQMWTDVSNWNLWDAQVTSSKLHGPFKKGQTGELHPKGGPKSDFELVEVTANKSFTSRSSLPLTTMDFVHTLHEEEGILLITHKIEMNGLLSFLFSRLIGNKLIKEMPQVLSNLEKTAQAKTV